MTSDINTATTLIDERWRPALHLTATTGFINDPNGLIVIDGQHHAFYQHNPHDVVHGPMHWGHAVSDDLVHWQELPVALYPDELGQCFSGSAVATPDGNVALIYTAHLERTGHEPLQTQCVAFANRELTRFESAPSNPVLDNPESIKDFRDPKVFWHTPTAAWIMLITLGRHIGIYRSEDLLTWHLSSEFGQGLGAPGDTPWECPDLVEVKSADGDHRWVLIVGIWSGAPGGGSGTQYFLGDFDGHQFGRDTTSADINWFDHGRDCYAAQSFAGRESLAPRVLAWCSNWQYANDTPTHDFRGALTLARDLDLVDTSAGLRLRQSVPNAVRDAFDLLVHDGEPTSGVYRLSRRVTLEPGQRMEFCLFGEAEPQFIIERTDKGSSWRLLLCRKSRLGDAQELVAFATDNVITLAGPSGNALELELFVDNGLVELFLDGGVDVATMCFYPQHPAGAVCTTCKS